VRKCEGKRPLGRSRYSSVRNFLTHLREIGWGGADWINLASNGDKWGTLVNGVVNFGISQDAWRFLSGCMTGVLAPWS
jgi:hypothetical protein